MDNIFLKAAASYFGQAGARKVELFTDGTIPVLALELVLTDENMAGIVERMRTMWADAEALAAQQAARAQPEMPSDTRMRDEYYGMDKRTKSQFGSFMNYRAWRLGQALAEVRAGKDVLVQETVELPAHVYLSPGECTELQKAMAVGRDEKGNYAVAPEDLTPEQREARGMPHWDGQAAPQGAEELRTGMSLTVEQAFDHLPPVRGADDLRATYIERTVAAHARLTGADSKPTSNADDFGGVPG